MFHNLLQNFKQPRSSFSGRFILSGMNIFHEPFARWARQYLSLNSTMNLLDIGCGGGKNVKVLSRSVKKAYGVDYSKASVHYAQAFTHGEFVQGRVEILEADVHHLPFADETFQVVTAFETVYFWQPIEDCLSEAHRVLAQGGQMMIACETSGDKAADFWAKKIGFPIYTPEELMDMLKALGMSCTLYTHPKRHWYAVLAIKK